MKFRARTGVEMAFKKRNIRGLLDLRTLSGRVDQVSEPYRAYMRITSIEMEKVRRGQERESAMHRVKNIDERFNEIEAEKAALLQALGERNEGNSTRAQGIDEKPGTRRNPEGFKIRY
jgi:hypothetical protein